MSENAHLAVFKEAKPASKDRIDFCLLGVSDQDDVLGYITCFELSPETLYWSHGGAFPPASKNVSALRCYTLMMEKCRSLGYKRIYTTVANTNKPMLKMHAHGGWKITGVRHTQGLTLLEHEWEIL